MRPGLPTVTGIRRRTVRRNLALATLVSLALVVVDTSLTRASGLTGGRIPASYRSFTLESATDSSGTTETTISQLQVPVVASVALSKGLDLVISSSAGSSSLDQTGADSPSLSGNSDITAQLFYRLASDRLMLQLGGNLPAGGATVTREELQVARALGHPLLGFHLKQYGQGFDVSLGLASAFGVGRQASIALGLGYIARGSYEFVENDPDFQPGDEISLSFGLDALGSPSSSTGASTSVLRLDATYRIFGTDQLDGEDLYEEGNQLEMQALGSKQGRRWGGFALGRLVLKSDDTALASAGEIGKVTQAPGTGILVRLGLDRQTGSRARLGAEFESQFFSGSDTPQTNGATFGVGPAFTWAWSNGAQFQARALYLTGTIDGDETLPEIDLRGWDFGFGLHWSPSD